MHRLGQYKGTDAMSALVLENYRILLVMSRFRIGLGFGDQSVDAVCRASGVDTATFLAVANLTLDQETGQVSVPEVSIESLLAYLHNSHDYFLDFRLPGIRRDLVEVLGRPGDELSRATIRYFDEYVAEVRKHMLYEEETVFPYVRALLRGEAGKGYNIGIFGTHHDQVEARLSEFKNILIKYYPARSTNEINGVLFDIFNCEQDLATHNAVEDRIFIPAVRRIEPLSGVKR
ncbi:MAG: hemerythrin domain-containing protein [Rikenellaceae bacterium]|jgi:regulator of cell morphogenesis and NO signaling|nr:hemerythrin domain-containing protein [Rikenellaceae bacterium]